MKKVMLILVVAILLTVMGCPAFAADPDEVTALRAELASTKAELNKLKYAGIPTIEQQIRQAPDNWKDAYGDTEKTQVYFNIKSAWVDIENCKKAIKLIASAINTITDPDDPNSLTARIDVLEGTTRALEGVFKDAVQERIDQAFEKCTGDNKALKPDDPNGVAK